MLDKEIIKLLLTREDLEINNEFDSFLCEICKVGNVELLKLIIHRKDLNVNVYRYFKSALYIACENNHEAIVKMLLTRKDLNVNIRNKRNHIEGENDENFNFTPLVIACDKNNVKIVKMLLKRKDIDLSLTYKFNNVIGDVLNLACNRSLKSFNYMIKRKDVDINNTMNNLSYLMFLCLKTIETNKALHCQIVKQLLERDDLNINIECKRYSSFYLACVKAPHLIKYFLKRKDLDIIGKLEKIPYDLLKDEKYKKMFKEYYNERFNKLDETIGLTRALSSLVLTSLYGPSFDFVF